MSYTHPSPAEAAEVLAEQLLENAKLAERCTNRFCARAYEQAAQLLFEQLLEKFQDSMEGLRRDKKELEAQVKTLKDENTSLRAQARMDA